MIRVTVNGEERALEGPLTAAELLERLGVRAVHVAVEIDREVVPRGRLAETLVRGGERIEIVHFVGGG